MGSLAAFHFAECFADVGHGRAGRGPAVWGTLGTSLLAHTIQHSVAKHSAQPMPSSYFRQRAQAHQYHCVHNSHQQWPGFCGPSVWRYGKHNYQLGILCRIPLFPPQTLPARRHVQCRQCLPPRPLPSCFLSSRHCRPRYTSHTNDTNLLKQYIPIFIHISRNQPIKSANTIGHNSIEAFWRQFILSYIWKLHNQTLSRVNLK